MNTDIIKNVLTKLATEGGYDQDLKDEVVFDDTHQRYMIIQTGMDEDLPVFDVLVSVKVAGDKLIIEHVTLVEDFEELFSEAGITKENIIFK